MLLTRLPLPVLAAILACGPGTPSGSATDVDTTTASGSTTSGDATTTTGTPTTTTATPTTGASTSTTDLTTTVTTLVTSTDTTTTTTSSTTAPDTTGEPLTGAPELVQFAARYFPGGLDRLVVRKADFGPGLCTSIIFVWPGMPAPGLTLPEQWGLQGAEIGNNIDTCLDLSMPVLPAGVPADSVVGTADWLSPGCPPTLDIDLTLTFPQQQPWIPPMDVFTATAIPIDGC